MYPYECQVYTHALSLLVVESFCHFPPPLSARPRMASPGVMRPASTLQLHHDASSRKRSLLAAFAPEGTAVAAAAAAAAFQHQPAKRGRRPGEERFPSPSSNSSSLVPGGLFTSFSSAEVPSHGSVAAWGSGRKRSSEQAWGAGANATWLLDDKGGFAGFAPEKRTRLSDTFQGTCSGKKGESALSSCSLPLSADRSPSFGHRQSSPTTTTSTSTSTVSVSAPASVSASASASASASTSPEVATENHRPALHSMLLAGNKRSRPSDADDVEMGCSPMRKRSHGRRREEAELDRPVYSQRYVNQLRDHYEKRAESKNHKLRREAAAEIAAKTQKTEQNTAKHASRIALENERLRHENHVLRCGMQTLSKRTDVSAARLQALERENNALKMRLLQSSRSQSAPQQIFSPGHVF